MNFSDNVMNQSRQSIIKKEEKKKFQDKVMSANNSPKATREMLQLTISYVN